jgi:hypothetical protein
MLIHHFLANGQANSGSVKFVSGVKSAKHIKNKVVKTRINANTIICDTKFPVLFDLKPDDCRDWFFVFFVIFYSIINKIIK